MRRSIFSYLFCSLSALAAICCCMKQKQPDPLALEFNDRAVDSLVIGHYEASLKLLDSALAIQPDLESALGNKVEVLSNLGRITEIELVIKKMCEANPRNLNALTGLGMYYDYIKDSVAASAIYKKALKEAVKRTRESPDSYQAFSDLWTLQLLLGKEAECEMTRKLISERFPEEKETFECVMTALEKDGKWSLIRSAYER